MLASAVQQTQVPAEHLFPLPSLRRTVPESDTPVANGAHDDGVLRQVKQQNVGLRRRKMTHRFMAIRRVADDLQTCLDAKLGRGVGWENPENGLICTVFLLGVARSTPATCRAPATSQGEGRAPELAGWLPGHDFPGVRSYRTCCRSLASIARKKAQRGGRSARVCVRVSTASPLTRPKETAARVGSGARRVFRLASVLSTWPLSTWPSPSAGPAGTPRIAAKRDQSHVRKQLVVVWAGLHDPRP